MKKMKCISSQETMFMNHKQWMGKTQIEPMINEIKDRVKHLKEDWGNMKETTGFNLDYPYMNLLGLYIKQMEELEEFYSSIKFEENIGGKTYKIKDYE